MSIINNGKLDMSKVNDGFTVSNSRNTMISLIEAARDSHVEMGGTRHFAQIGCDTVESWVNTMCDRLEESIKELEEVSESLEEYYRYK